MPDAATTCDVDGVAVEVPFEVVPSKYIVPLPPFAAVIVVLPQKVPAPLATTVVGSAFTVTNWVFVLGNVLFAAPAQPVVVLLITQK